MAQFLKLAQLAKAYDVPKVDVRPAWVETHL